MTSIVASTRAYERWLRTQTPVQPAGLRAKHALMRDDVGKFLRGTYYRWASQFPVHCATLARGARVLCVGDAHIENFGTWRDAEGRLAWGVNDADEAWTLPIAHDLVRVLTSALLVRRHTEQSWLPARRMAAALDEGYRDALAAGGRPYVLAETHAALRELALRRVHDPVAWWKKLEGECRPVRQVPTAVQRLLRQSLPAGSAIERWASRAAGVGSLGRARYVLLATHGGARIAREAKPIVPSAAAWSEGVAAPEALSGVLVTRAVRAPDPHLRFVDGWVVRRLAPDCSRVELRDALSPDEQRHLLHAMGAELANVQLGQRSASWLRKASGAWDAGALLDAARVMRDVVEGDWAAFREVGVRR